MEEKKENKFDANKRLKLVFDLLKKRDGIIIADRKTHFNDTELRLISEVLAVMYAGERIISTQLAKRLGVTRSAVSQIVNRLEAAGVLRRVPDDVDRKIAYVEVTGETLEAYEDDIEACRTFVDKVVDEFGAERFETMCEQMQEFMKIMETVRAEERGKRKEALKNR